MAKGKGFISEFKTFIMRGNVIDLAVGVIIGGAFQKIVNSLVNDIVMPLISLLTGGIDFSNWFWCWARANSLLPPPRKRRVWPRSITVHF